MTIFLLFPLDYEYTEQKRHPIVSVNNQSNNYHDHPTIFVSVNYDPCLQKKNKDSSIICKLKVFV